MAPRKEGYFMISELKKICAFPAYTDFEYVKREIFHRNKRISLKWGWGIK